MNNKPVDEIDEMLADLVFHPSDIGMDNERRAYFKARLLQWGTRQRLIERQKITYPKLNGYKDFSSHTDWSKAQFWEAPITIMQEENRDRIAELQASLKDGGNDE